MNQFIIKIGYSIFWTSPVVVLAILTLKTQKSIPDTVLTIMLAVSTVLLTCISAVKVGDIWHKRVIIK